MAPLNDHVVFRSASLSKESANKLIPIDTLFDAYFDGDLDIPGDISNRNDFDPSIWIGKPSLAERMHSSSAGTETEQPATNGTAIAREDC